MFENEKEENVVEQTLEIDKDSVSGASVEAAPITSSEKNEDLQNYLDPKLFDDIKVINIDKNNKKALISEIDPKVKELYANTFGDISENTLIEGRVVGMNDRDVLIDIGFKSEGIIDRSEFKELPSVGDEIEAFIVCFEDRKGRLILSKERADFEKRWDELRTAHTDESVIKGRIIKNGCNIRTRWSTLTRRIQLSNHK